MTGHFSREAYGQSFFIGTLMNTHGRWIFSFERLADVRKNCSRGGVLLKKIILDLVENRMSRLIRFIFNSLI